MKLCNLFLFILLCITCNTLKAQQLSVADLIKAWNTDDLSQTEKAEDTYEDMLQHLNAKSFALKMDSLQNYLKQHDNPRIWIRTVFYEILGNHKLNTPPVPQYVANLKRAITLASLQNDMQLLSEIYTLYADNYVNNDAQNRLFYILKAIEMQRRVGFRYFPHIYLRFLSISKALYYTMDYRQSLHYGQECLSLMKSPVTNIYCYILQLDLMGASYRDLNMADSSAWYYRQISKILTDYPADYPVSDSAFHQIWEGIALGGVGQSLLLKKNYAGAYKLIWQNLNSSRFHEQWTDAAMAANALASVNSINKDYDSALFYYKNAYQWAHQSDDLLNIIKATRNIADIYRMKNMYDSAYLYLDQYHIYRDSLQIKMNTCQLANLKAQVEFDDMQTSLATAQTTINRQHQIRNAILICIALIAIITLLLYNRYRLKQNHRRQLLERKNKIAAMEVIRAKELVADFATNIKEKDRLIRQLQKEENTGIEQRLKEYTLITDEEWTKFKGEFVKVYPNFYTRLYKVLHKMTPSEERLAALIYLRLSNQQIASTLGISKESVSRGKRRLSGRMALPPDISFENYLLEEQN